MSLLDSKTGQHSHLESLGRRLESLEHRSREMRLGRPPVVALRQLPVSGAKLVKDF